MHSMPQSRFMQGPECHRLKSEDFGGLFDLYSQGIVILSLDAVVLAVNEAAERMLGQPLSKLYGKPFPFKVTPEGTIEISVEGNGQKTPLQFRSKLIRENGSAKGYMIEIKSLTTLKIAEAAAERAKETSKLKSDFLAAMSHEIRNPMTGVIGMTSLLLDTTLTEEQQRYVGAIKSSGEMLLTILNDVLDLSKIEAGKFNLELSDFRLIDMIEDTIGLFSEPSRRKGLLLTNVIKPDVPRILRGDPTRIRQVITNLVSNAVKFTMHGRVLVRAFVEETAESHFLRIEVSDTGPGLAGSEAQELFKPFEQIRRVMQGVPSGTGLGLALSKQLVEVMNGQIGVESTCGKGSTFWFTIPISRASNSNNRPWDLSSKSVMIVSQDPEMGQILSEQIKVTGAKCKALTPTAAVRSLQKARSNFDVIIFDQKGSVEPKGSRDHGQSLSQKLLEFSAGQELPWVLLCQDSKAVRIAGANVEVVEKSTLCQSQICGRVARLLGVKQSKGDFDRRKALLAVTKMQPISRHDGRPRLLVVEDDPINQAVMKMMLQRLGFSIDVVTNGHEAIDAAAKSSYAAILMDYCLPELDGISATRVIRRKEQVHGRRTPIIATTASVLPSVSERCFEAGMDGCLTKPFTIEQLAESLQKFIGASTEHYVDENAIKLLTSLSESQDSADFLGEIVDLFDNAAPQLFDRLRAAIVARDSIGVAKVAHRLKGSAGHFGAHRLTECLEKLETHGNAGNLAACEALFDQAKSEYSRVIMILKEQKALQIVM